MRVLFVNPAGGLGGSERSLLDLVQSLRETRPEIEARLLVLDDGDLVAAARKLGIDCDVLPMPEALAELGEFGVHDRRARAVALVRAAGQLPAYLARFRRTVLALDPNVVHTNGMKAHTLAAAALRDRPLVVHLRDFASERRLTRHVFRVLPERSRVVTNSRAVERDLLELVPALKTRVVYNAIDTETFTPGPTDSTFLAQLSELAPPGSGAIGIGLIATYAWWKGHRTFLAAAGHLRRAFPSRELRFYVIGGPVYATRGSELSAGELRSAIEQEGLAGSVGLVPFRADVERVYRGLDIVVHASTRREPFGRTIVEAMASGRPVVVSRAGGAVELFVEEQSGLGFTPGDPEDLARAVARLIEDEPLRVALGARARSHAVERFDRARLGPEMSRIYEELVP